MGAWGDSFGACGGGSSIGTVIDELRFTLQPVIQLQGAISPIALTGATEITNLAGSVQEQSVSGAVSIIGLTGNIAVQEI